MADYAVQNLEALQKNLHDEIAFETARIEECVAQIAKSEKRIANLKKAAAGVASGISALLGIETRATTPTLGKRIPFAWGDGTRIAYRILREAKKPLSVGEMADMALAEAGHASPSKATRKSMMQVLFGSVKENVKKGRLVRHETKPMTFSPAPQQSLRENASELPEGTW